MSSVSGTRRSLRLRARPIYRPTLDAVSPRVARRARCVRNCRAVNDATTTQRIERLRSVPIFSELDDEGLSAILACATEFDAPAGHVLAEAGMAGAGLFVIEEGTVTVEVPGHPRELGPGDFFGELSLLVPDTPRAARVRTNTKHVALLCRDTTSSVCWSRSPRWRSGCSASWRGASSTRRISLRGGDPRRSRRRDRSGRADLGASRRIGARRRGAASADPERLHRPAARRGARPRRRSRPVRPSGAKDGRCSAYRSR